MKETPVRWGIVSTAKIGLEKVIPGIQRSKTGIAYAIASRSMQAALESARTLAIDRAYGSYEELLADPDVDAIYNPLPNHLHVPFTLQAVAAGKHVLCEKPIALNAHEATSLLQLPKDKLVVENFMVRAHLQWIRAKDIIQSGALGELKAIQCFFSYFNADPHNIRNQPNLGGGALMDIGCYAQLSGRYFFDAEPQRVVSLVDRDPTFKTDRMTSALLDFGQNRHLSFTVSTQLTPYQRFNLVGTQKRLEILIPVNAPQDKSVEIRLDDGSALGDVAIQRETIPPCDQYAEMVDMFGRALTGASPLPFGIEDAIQNMKVIDALFASEKSGAWEPVL